LTKYDIKYIKDIENYYNTEISELPENVVSK